MGTNLQTDKRPEITLASLRNLKSKLAKLSGLCTARRTHHQIFSPVVLREGDNITDILSADDEHDEAIHPQSNPAVRRCAKFESLEQMGKEKILLVWRNAEHFKHLRLQFTLVNPNAPAPDLYSIENDIIGLGANFTELARFQ